MKVTAMSEGSSSEFPANCVTSLLSTLFFNTNMDDSDDEC